MRFKKSLRTCRPPRPPFLSLAACFFFKNDQVGEKIKLELPCLSLPAPLFKLVLYLPAKIISNRFVQSMTKKILLRHFLSQWHIYVFEPALPLEGPLLLKARLESTDLRSNGCRNLLSHTLIEKLSVSLFYTISNYLLVPGCGRGR